MTEPTRHHTRGTESRMAPVVSAGLRRHLGHIADWPIAFRANPVLSMAYQPRQRSQYDRYCLTTRRSSVFSVL
mgnify:CR=1 FL=1